MNASAEMPRYKCHKEVWALRVAAISDIDGNAEMTLSFEEPGYAPIKVGQPFWSKHNPVVGGYYVVYDDGYTSFSPAKAFEEGYRLVVQRTARPTIEELEKILNGPAPDVRIEPDGTVTQGFSDNGTEP